MRISFGVAYDNEKILQLFPIVFGATNGFVVFYIQIACLLSLSSLNFMFFILFWAAAPKGAMSYRIGGILCVRTYVRTYVHPPLQLGLRALQPGLKGLQLGFWGLQPGLRGL